MFKPMFAAFALAAAANAGAANPVTSKIFTADPAALVDNGRVYLYVGHDEAAPKGKDYVMKEWRIFSTCDMQHWTEHPDPIPVGLFSWAKGDAWASDITKRGGKYYFYAPVEHKTIAGKAIGVAVSDSPLGPFTDARGSALVTNDMTRETTIAWDDIDPGVFIDDDGQAYLYWGNRILKYARLKSSMTEFDGPIHTVALDAFTEAPYLHKHDGRYYLTYSRFFPEETVYMTGPTATGPWTFGGTIMQKNTKTKTIHQAIVDFNGKSYIFYHNANLPGGGEFRRSVAVEELHYGKDGAILPVAQTAQGPAANPTAACKSM